MWKEVKGERPDVKNNNGLGTYRDMGKDTVHGKERTVRGKMGDNPRWSF